MQVRNKWNGGFYEVVEIGNNQVTLKRSDNSVFTISKTEYYFNYSEKK